jgi:phasin family protein
MPFNFPEIKAFGTAPLEAFSAAAASSTKGLQSIAAETTDYSKKSFEKSRAHLEKVIGVKNINEAIQLQSEFAKSAYEDFMAQATKIGEMYSSLVKEALKPISTAASAQAPAAATQWKAPVTTKQNSSFID